jgi:hypothetical protein
MASSTITRRRFVSGLATCAAVTALPCGMRRAHAFELFADLPYYDQYHRGAARILTGIRDTQTDRITDEMSTAWARTRKGGTVYSQVTAGHFPTEETALDRIGNPGVFGFLERNADEAAYAALDPADVIITNTINTNNIPAMARGIRVLGVTVNYYPFDMTPPEQGYQIEYDGKLLKIGDASSMVIDSQIPWYNGLVHPPRHSGFPVLPSGGFANAVVYWMCAAAFDRLRAGKGDQGDIDGARYYIDTCIERLAKIGADRPKVLHAAETLAGYVECGARWWVYGANHALVSDAVGVACGPMVTRSYKADEIREGDIVLIGAYTSDHPDEIAVARRCREMGALTVAVTPFSTDGDASGTRLYKEVDIAFNTYSPESMGIVPVKGRDRDVCPTSGVMGDIAMWLIFAAWAEEMGRRGAFPYFWKGFFMKDGRGYNDRIKPFYEQRGW